MIYPHNHIVRLFVSKESSFFYLLQTIQSYLIRLHSKDKNNAIYFYKTIVGGVKNWCQTYFYASSKSLFHLHCQSFDTVGIGVKNWCHSEYLRFSVSLSFLHPLEYQSCNWIVSFICSLSLIPLSLFKIIKALIFNQIQQT